MTRTAVAFDGESLAQGVNMAGRQIGTAVVAAVYGTVHYMVVAGEIAKGAGWRNLPGPVLEAFDLSFICSVVIVVGFLVPKILTLNIAISKALLTGWSWCGILANSGLDRVRIAMILVAERTASWLRQGRS